jgi:acyl-coenzyme A thioesterase PaaI-like protein
MQLSENVLKWVMRLYPPFFFQRIWVRRFEKGFTAVEVKINRSLLNRNYNATIFGGTIFAAADPFYALMFDQILQRKGFKTVVWLKSASIQYIKPGRTALFFHISLNDQEIQEVETALIERGKFVRTYPVTIVNTSGETCAIMHNEVYIKDVRYQQTKQATNTI